MLSSQASEIADGSKSVYPCDCVLREGKDCEGLRQKVYEELASWSLGQGGAKGALVGGPGTSRWMIETQAEDGRAVISAVRARNEVYYAT